MVLPSARHKDTSCWSHKAVPVRHNCSAPDVLAQRIQCSSPLKSTPAELWLNMWQVAREKCVCVYVCVCVCVCVRMPSGAEYRQVLYMCVSMYGWSVKCVAVWRGGGSSWLVFGVCTPAFELLGVVWGHLWKVSEDVMVGLITWKKKQKKTWA